MSRPNLLFTFREGWSSPSLTKGLSYHRPAFSPQFQHHFHNAHHVLPHRHPEHRLRDSECRWGAGRRLPSQDARCGRRQISETSYNQLCRVFFNILSRSVGWVANPTQRPTCMTSSTTVAVRPLIFPFLLFLLFLCKKGTRAFLERTCKMLRMMRLLFLLFWVAPRWYLRYLTQRSASSLIGSIQINIGIRHLVWAAGHPHQTQTMGWHRVAAPRKTLPVSVQAKQIVTILVKKSSQLVSVGFWPYTALAVRLLILWRKIIFMEGVPWERELRTRFTQFSGKGSELVGFDVESTDLDKFSLHNVFCMKDVVRTSGKSKQTVQPSTNANRKAVECKTWHSLPDNAFAVDMTNN